MKDHQFRNCEAFEVHTVPLCGDLIMKMKIYDFVHWRFELVLRGKTKAILTYNTPYTGTVEGFYKTVDSIIASLRAHLRKVRDPNKALEIVMRLDRDYRLFDQLDKA